MMLRTLMAGIVCGALAAAAIPADAGSNPEASCKSAKAKASGKKAADILKAFGNNEKKPEGARLATSISKARSKFTKAFLKEDSKGGCSTTGDADTIEAKVDSFVGDVLARLAPTSTTLPTTTTTVPSGTTTTTTLLSCNAGAWPTCNGVCPDGAHCGRTDPTSDCGCVPTGTVPCGQSTGPECDGTCPAGLACGEPAPGAGCQCLASPGSCSEAGTPGAPECGGECPSWAPYCTEGDGGSCVCSATLTCAGTMPSCDDPGLCTNDGLTCGAYGFNCRCLAACGSYPSCTGGCSPTVGQVCSTDLIYSRCVCVTAAIGCNGDSDPSRCEYAEYQGACPPNTKCYYSPATGACGCRII